jgi:hypothetical protein
MRCMIIHKTNAHWETGAAPGPELVAAVGDMIGTMSRAGLMLAGEGLRPTAQGVRLAFSRGGRRIIPGPFGPGRGTPDGFVIVRAATLDDAIAWGTRLARVRSASEVDIRPVTEAWDIGIVKAPPDPPPTRFMLEPRIPAATPRQADERQWAELLGEMKGAGVLVSAERVDDTVVPLRVTVAAGRQSVFDGPFAETKELIGGFVLLALAARDDARTWLSTYASTVGAEEVDALFLAEP